MQGRFSPIVVCMSERLSRVPKKNIARNLRQDNRPSAGAQATAGLGKHPLIRTLYSILDQTPPQDNKRFSERLTQHLDFAHSLKLSEVPAVLSALEKRASQISAQASTTKISSPDPLEAAFHRVYQGIIQTINQSFECSAEQSRIPLPEIKLTEGTLTLTAFQSFYHAHQLEMSAKIQGLRRYLSDTLKTRSSSMTQLIYLDSALDESIGIPLRNHFSTIPKVVQRYAEKTECLWRECQEDATRQNRLLDQFITQLKQLLLLECELRLQPIRGLLEASLEEVREIP